MWVDDVDTLAGGLVVPEVVVERQLDHATRLDQRDRRGRRRDMNPPVRRGAILQEIVESDAELIVRQGIAENPVRH
jgi:hypothetical protein